MSKRFGLHRSLALFLESVSEELFLYLTATSFRVLSNYVNERDVCCAGRKVSLLGRKQNGRPVQDMRFPATSLLLDSIHDIAMAAHF